MGRLLLRILSRIFCTLLLYGTVSAQSADSIAVTIVRGVVWDALKGGYAYNCVADENRAIMPYDPAMGEYTLPAKIRIAGIPNTAIVLTFDLPGVLYGTAAGIVRVSYDDSSVAVVDLASGEILGFHNPSGPLQLSLDEGGNGEILFTGNPSPTIDATEGDTFLGEADFEAVYRDSGTAQTAHGRISMAATVASYPGDGFLWLRPENPVLTWSAVVPGKDYHCTVDSLSNIYPIEPDFPEVFEPCALTILGSPGAAVELRFQLPAKLLTSEGRPEATVRFDSASARIISAVKGDPRLGWSYAEADLSQPVRLTLDVTGSGYMRLAADLTLFPDAREGDTLTAIALCTAEYYGFARSGGAEIPAQQVTIGIRFQALIARTVSLSQNYPNPFNPSTNIEYQIPQTTHARVAVYDLLGREIAVLVDQVMGPGKHTATWNGEGLAGGVYFYRLLVGRSALTKSLLLIR